VSVVAAVDIGGSGLRVQCRYAGRLGPVRSAPGVRVGERGIDVPTLVRDARSLIEEPPEAVAWSMRGLLFLADREAVLREVVSGLGADRTAVVSDAVANVVGAVGELSPGAVVAAGTGAVAFGTDFADHWTRVDGWGHVLGDAGSGAWIGVEGLRAALRAADGLPRGSAALLDAGTAAFGSPETWPRQLMTTSDAPDRLAGFAPEVSRLAGEDDAAAAICEEAGRALADALLAAAAGLDDPLLAATGGVLAGPAIAAALTARLAEEGRSLTPPRGGALDGAMVLAARLGEGGRLPEHPAYLLVA
jgi:N-acetylglucosamine kinase-like BadF-type ATPase